MANITNLDLQKQMFLIIKQWEKGSERKQEVCDEYNLTICKFDYWLKKYRTLAVPKDFIEIKCAKKIPAKEQIVRFHFSGEVSAEVPSDLAIDFMNQLIVR
ncbi:MAG: hypothetical protein U9N04_03185 [Patescibacteria group bacterium]|nr:hypothetical protein [Patescibacteria group bacterium]